jgi:hypothetical protein
MPPVYSMSREQTCSNLDIERALLALGETSERVRASRWPGALEGLDLPGLYSWWTDQAGAELLTAGLEQSVVTGRIYAGQTGATKWPSGRVGKMTLRDRLGGNHLRGSIHGSTFRRTLAAALFEPLSLELIAPGRLARVSEHRLSRWTREHLEVAVYAFANRDALAWLEARVLTVLDPPLNLEGMAASPLRTRLSALRRQLTQGPLSITSE